MLRETTQEERIFLSKAISEYEKEESKRLKQMLSK